MAALGGTNAAAVAMPEVSVNLVFTDTRLDFEAMQWEWRPKSNFWVIPSTSGQPKCPSRGLKAWVLYPVL